MDYLLKYKPSKKEVVEEEIPIFIVDDDRSYLYALGFHLKKDSNCKIYCYTSGEECLENLSLKPKIIILDYFLNTGKPDAMNGLEVLKQIKRISRLTKVIMLSGQETLQIAVKLIKSGAYTYVIKDLEALSSIKKLVDNLCRGIK
jgi:two-component system OmpR family response regulator